MHNTLGWVSLPVFSLCLSQGLFCFVFVFPGLSTSVKFIDSARANERASRLRWSGTTTGSFH
eukprot:jgi/Botrbrau1/5817/Bobra.0366s0003.1